MDEWDPVIKQFEEAFLHLDLQVEPEIGNAIRPIVLNNLSRGRLNFYLSSNPNHTPFTYVLLVANTYQELAPDILNLQITQDSTAWETFLPWLQETAYCFLARKGMPRNQTTEDLAMQCADDAALKIIAAYFPYDTSFLSWAARIVFNTCLKKLQTPYFREYIEPVDIEDDSLDLFFCTELSYVEDLVFIRLDLTNAVLNLTPMRKQVIALRYGLGLNFKEIASRMEKSASAAMKLHFDALAQLRKLI